MGTAVTLGAGARSTCLLKRALSWQTAVQSKFQVFPLLFLDKILLCLSPALFGKRYMLQYNTGQCKDSLHKPNVSVQHALQLGSQLQSTLHLIKPFPHFHGHILKNFCHKLSPWLQLDHVPSVSTSWRSANPLFYPVTLL